VHRRKLDLIAAGLTALFIATFPGATPASAQSANAQGANAGDASANRLVESSIVKIFSRRSLPDCQKPWTTQAPQEISGSGVVIEGNRILTNAHVVLYSHQLQIQGNESGDKVSASIEAIAPGIDLAVLKLKDESFFASHPPLARESSLPEVKASVMAYGYPTGGNSLSITKGIVSRIEFAPYSYSTSGLRIQVDAAINPGNSGGPVLLGDRMIGLAFSTLGGTQNISYIIPDEEIDLFLGSVKDGVYSGKPMIYDTFQTLENPALRAFLKLDKGAHGLVVAQPEGTSTDYPLRKWDLLCKIGDAQIDDEGMIKIKDNVRVSFNYMIQRTARNGTAPLTVIRSGRELRVEVPVSYEKPLAITQLNGSYPSYFVFGPLVFSAATEDFFQSIVGNNNGAGVYSWLSLNGSPLLLRRGRKPLFPGEELIVVSSPLFPNRLSEGYGNPMGEVLRSVNGTPIENLRQLVRVLKDARDDFVIFDFAGDQTESLVFPRAETLAETEVILNDNGIRRQGSPGVMEAWNTGR
jgi:S1-C subfamily serine protease